MTEQVNHPRHYNARKDGLECIDIIRHYTFNIGCAIKYLWRAGLKTEEGKPDREKEIEDLNKALWYIEDYVSSRVGGHTDVAIDADVLYYLRSVTAYSIEEITAPYADLVAVAMYDLALVGFVYEGYVYSSIDWLQHLITAKVSIRRRIEELEKETTD